MTLNATCLVQMLNFLGAWCIVRYLFVSPALKLRDTVREPLEGLSAERDTLQSAVRSVQDKEYRAWHLWALQAHKVMKGQSQQPRHREPMLVRTATPEVPAQEIEKVAHQLTELLITRLQELP